MLPRQMSVTFIIRRSRQNCLSGDAQVHETRSSAEGASRDLEICPDLGQPVLEAGIGARPSRTKWLGMLRLVIGAHRAMSCIAR